ncbi:hypothetical protein OE88DRAFT_172450 [Heliocybe sulcata]|uniref:Uncharacterized protein n=1 Tax=Heliocybe sulcata TaxID=5364 RepID=A0A5C3NA77_9AGAM|nr:hypothetical protein OE88DRAFT_172450 [Heliocybe sulcata]
MQLDDLDHVGALYTFPIDKGWALVQQSPASPALHPSPTPTLCDDLKCPDQVSHKLESSQSPYQPPDALGENINIDVLADTFTHLSVTEPCDNGSDRARLPTSPSAFSLPTSHRPAPPHPRSSSKSSELVETLTSLHLRDNWWTPPSIPGHRSSEPAAVPKSAAPTTAATAFYLPILRVRPPRLGSIVVGACPLLLGTDMGFVL